MSTVNPYNAPATDVAGVENQAYGEVKMLSASGRLGRVRYIGYSVALSLVAFALMFVVSLLAAVFPQELAAVALPLLFGIVAIGATVVSFMLGIQRLHDLDLSGWWVLVLLVPIVGALFALYLLLAPGTQGANRFGSMPPPNTTGVIILALSLPVLVFLIGILAAIAIPAYQDYVKRAEEMATESQLQ